MNSLTTTKPLAAWLREWHEHLAYLEALEEEERQATAAQRPPGLRLLSSSPALTPATPGPAVQAGQVRVLRPLPITGARDLRPVLVLQTVAGERWLCAPFSPLSEPAHEGEWRTPLAANDPRLSVLSLWDSAEIEDTLLVSARLVQQVDVATLSQAEAILTAWQQGGTLPESLAAETGPRVVSLTDPRHDYTAEVGGALEPWAELRSFSLKTVKAYSAAADSTLALAASPSGSQALGHTYHLGDSGLRLVITLKSPMEAQLSVLDTAGQPSLTLDGGSLLFADGSQQAFTGSELGLPLARLAQGFAVTTAEGLLLSLKD
jgi:hypothetical protein